MITKVPGVLWGVEKETDFETRLANLTEQGRIIGIMQTKIMVTQLILKYEQTWEITPRRFAQYVLDMDVPPETAL